MEQVLERAISKGYNVNLEALTTLVPSRRIEPRVEGVKHNLRRHISGAENVTTAAQENVTSAAQENVTSATQEMPHHQGATWTMGQGLSLFAENKYQLKTGGLCTVPSLGVDQSQNQRLSQSQHIVGPLEKSKEGSQQTDHLRRRQEKASPGEGVARLKHHWVKT